jgi:hypothetical protein
MPGWQSSDHSLEPLTPLVPACGSRRIEAIHLDSREYFSGEARGGMSSFRLVDVVELHAAFTRSHGTHLPLRSIARSLGVQPQRAARSAACCCWPSPELLRLNGWSFM